MDLKKLRRAYNQHVYRCKRKRDAAGNPVKMRLTFEEWLSVWVESGKLHLRGIKKGSYCMSRCNDLGHYEMGNVFIQSSAHNIRDAAPIRNENLCKPCTADGITIYPSVVALRAALGQGKSGTASPNFRFV